MIQGLMKFNKEVDCYEDAMRCIPNYDTWDGPDAPAAQLFITAYDDLDRVVSDRWRSAFR